MSGPSQRMWKWSVIGGLASWIALTVTVGAINDDPSDGTPVLIAFATGGALFFGAVFGAALWQTRARADPELDRVYTELAIAPAPVPSASRALGGMRSVVRAYIVLGAAVTALGLLAVLQEGLEFGSAAATVGALVAIVVAWAAAVPLVLRRANAASVAVLAPLGLRQNGTVMAGERHGRRVSIEITAAGSVTRVDAPDGAIVIHRKGHDGASWLRDLQEAEMQAAGRGR